MLQIAKRINGATVLRFFWQALFSVASDRPKIGGATMNRLEDGHYAIMLRDDYRYHFMSACRGTTRDSCVQEAMLQYMQLPEDLRYRETDRQRVGIWQPMGADLEYHMVIDTVAVPDDLAERFRELGEGDVDQALNTAIRLWLESRGVQGLEP
jgi:hypothetical protein